MPAVQRGPLGAALCLALLVVSAQAQSKQPITPQVIRSWQTIRQTALSGDGKWFAWVEGQAQGNSTLHLRRTTEGATETVVPVGENGGSMAFSGDSRWLGYLIAPPKASPGRGGRGGRGGAADSTRAAPATTNTFVLMNLATGEKREFSRIRRFSFNTDTATWVVMQGYGGTGGGAAGAGGSADLLLYHLADGAQFNMGKVDEYAFDKDGRWLAWTMDAPDQVGNGIQLRDMRSGVSRALEFDRVIYSRLAWVDSSRALSAVRGRIDSVAKDTVFSVVAFADFGADGPRKTVRFDPTGRQDFPKGWKLASERAPQWSTGLTAVFFGIREGDKSTGRGPGAAGRAAAPGGAPGAGGAGAIPPGGRGASPAAAGGDTLPTLILWHYKDTRLQSQQIVQEQADRRINFLAEYRVKDDRFVQLADSTLRSVTVTPGDQFAYGTDSRAYDERASYTGRNYQDVYRVDLADGSRKLLQRKKPTGAISAAPDGKRVLFWGKDGNYWVMDLTTGDSVNITRSVPVSFVNTDDDHNNLFPPARPSRGWTEDGSAVILTDGWDLWKVPVPPAKGPAVNLTGDGRRTQVRYQTIYRFATDGGRGGFGSGAIDLTKPLYVGTYGEWTKKEGLSRIDPGKAGATSLIFGDEKIGVIKASDADVFLFTRQSFTEYPDWWAFKPGFSGSYRLTDVDSQKTRLAWSSGTRLINYTSAKGDRLQGTLYLPADYQPGRKYPMLVTIYEKRSQNRNFFVSPSETRAPDPTQYTSRGYVVLDPDIVFKVNDPGMSAVWCVIPAVKAAIATGMVDPSKVGLWGHSWGGYQTAFLVTQTNIFAAAVAGAPLTNMVSMYASVYWNSGSSDASIFESSQGRFKGNFIENYQAYIRNSPVFHADKVTTPLIILHNDKDGAVDYNQGITYYNTLRQLGKKVILLEYVGENHGLARAPNQRDYAMRMEQFFDHYLRGAPAPDWLENGVPRVKMEEYLRELRDSTARAAAPHDSTSRPAAARDSTRGGGRDRF